MPRFDTILVGVDFSPYSAAAVDLAADLAAKLEARIVLVHAFHEPLVASALGGAGPTAELSEKIRQEAATALRGEARRIEGAGRPVEVRVVESSPAEGIASEAGSLGADLVVIGTRGRTGLEHVLLGSVAERTIRIAPCPVVTVNREKGRG